MTAGSKDVDKVTSQLEAMSLSVLPDAVKELTLQHMDFTSLLLLVNSSKDLKNDLIRYRIRNCAFSLRMLQKMNDIIVSYRSEINLHRFSFFTPENGQFYRENRKTLELRKVGEFQMKGTSIYEGSWEFVTENIFEPVILTIEHLRELFPRLKMNCLEIDLCRVTDIDALCDTLEDLSCRQVSLNMTGEDPSEKTRRLLPCLRDIEHLELRMFHIPFDFQDPIYAESIEISMATWVDNEKLSTWEFRSCRLSSTRYTSERYIEFINMWMEGAFGGMEKMAMCWNRHDVDRELVLSATQARKWNEMKMEGTNRGVGEYAKHYYRRRDGKVAVLRTYRQYFQFNIWKGKPVVD